MRCSGIDVPLDCFSQRTCRTFTAFAALSFFVSSNGFFDLSTFAGSDFLSFDDLAFGGMFESK